MKEIITFNKSNPLSPLETNNLIDLTDKALTELNEPIPTQGTYSVPISKLTTLGAGVASLVPSLNSIINPSQTNNPVYEIVNKTVKDTLKTTKNGKTYGFVVKANGKSTPAILKQASNSPATLAIDPATMMMAVALFSIEQQLNNIAETQKRILSFLEIEKHAEIEADVETLSSLIAKYKHNWDNEKFIASNHKIVLDIQRSSRKHINSYQKTVQELISSKQLLTMQSKVQTTLNELQKNFKYYRLALFAFSMSSLIEILLSGNFDKENILNIKNEIDQSAFSYRSTYNECSVYLEKLEKTTIEQGLLKGVGATSKAMGKLIGSIPKIKNGQVDEFFLDSANKLGKKATLIEQEVISTFAEMSDPGTKIFTDKMDDLIVIYNQTTEIRFDQNNLYLIAN